MSSGFVHELCWTNCWEWIGGGDEGTVGGLAGVGGSNGATLGGAMFRVMGLPGNGAGVGAMDGVIPGIGDDGVGGMGKGSGLAGGEVPDGGGDVGMLGGLAGRGMAVGEMGNGGGEVGSL
ncbi:hypothetical protein CTI12_AA553970 [Artemisia annua]|uniref:Uncharacterized protein n=1 Tax=Artemisia annua TaxID=35608 RepID=A0A2U1KXI9_ARTAN|nr:hypothetical protein CTI12_AA553970 [Artemisia annua]